MGRDVRVLNVDDQLEFAELTATLLERESDRIAVRTATSPDEGLEMLATNEVDCIVSDYEMPGTDGIDFLESVREDYPELPFILFTGKGSEEIASDAISAGVTDYLQKQSSTEQYTVLANRITNAVDAHLSREMLQERTRRLETLISNLPGIVYRSENEPGWPIETIAGEVQEVTGYTAEEIESGGVNWGGEILHPEDRDSTWELVQERLAEDGTFEVTYRIVTADGAVKWMWERGRGVDTDDGELDALEGFITDITERRERERDLKEARMKLDALGRAFPDVAFIKDIDGNYVEAFAGPESEILLSGSPESYEHDRHVRDVFEGETLDRVLRMIRTAIETGEVQSLEYRLAVRSGVRWFHARIAPIADEIEGKRAVVWVARDVTERKSRERTLEETRERMEFALDATDSIIFETDLETGTVTRHGPIERLYGDVPSVSPETFHEEFVHPEDRDRVKWMERKQIMESGTVDFEFRTHPDTGEVRWIDTEARVRTDAETAPDTLIGLSTDVTDRKQGERELTRLNERLEEFATVVSHDLRSPLTVADGRLALAEKECESPHIASAREAIERSRTLIDDLLLVARDGERLGELEPVALGEVIERCWINVDTGDASFANDVDSTIRADPIRLRQVLENLVQNAVEHGGEDVCITVGELEDGFYFEDDGPGIPDDVRGDVFDTGYSTSEEGIGLGLSIVARIVDAHGWEIDVTSSTEGGTRFEITGVGSTVG